MLAVTISHPGGPEGLELREVEDPEPGPGEVLVRVFAVALDPSRARPLSHSGSLSGAASGGGERPRLGIEFAGEVAWLGAGTEGLEVGERVFGPCPGGAYAELLAVDRRLLWPLPDTLSFEAAAAAPWPLMSAREALRERAGLRAGERVTVLGAGGRFGAAAVQLAAALGAGDVRRDPPQPDPDPRFATGVIVDAREPPAGGRAPARRSPETGRLARGPFPPAASERELIDLATRAEPDILPRLAAGTIRPALARVFPIDEVAEAHRAASAGPALAGGTIVLRL